MKAPGDARSFTYEQLQLRKEVHEEGIWSGWTVEHLPDEKGRLGGWKISDGTTVREFGFLYDNRSRLEQSISPRLTSIYGWNGSGKLKSVSRGKLTSTWEYDDENATEDPSKVGLLSSFTNAFTSGPNLNFTFPGRTDQHRISSRMATIGRSWTGMDYDDAGQLHSATVGGRSLAYAYDAYGNRTAQGADAAHGVNSLDQITDRTLSARGYGVFGIVDPLATVEATHPGALNGEGLTVDPQSGEFYKWWNLPLNAPSLVDVKVRGTLAGAGAQGADAVSEHDLRLVVPPQSESFAFDAAGRLKEDAFWNYTEWEGPDRLKRMERKPGMLRIPAAVSEVIDFDYDADGRRTRKTRTVTFNSNRTEVESSRVLWAGWLPVLEELSRNGKVTARRWFQWGADLSGTLDGASGIGGLLAIFEEKPSGKVRTFYPVQDGLGNVTAVLDADSGKIVARYDYGPFGEPVGEYGEVDVCPFRFQTKWYDRESEHYYFGYRYYSPRLGRWLSRDPLGEAGGVNLYAYCGNDPVNRHDPVGLSERFLGPDGQDYSREEMLLLEAAAEMKQFRETYQNPNADYLAMAAFAPAAVTVAALALPAEGVAGLTASAYAGADWLLAGGGMKAISMWGARIALTAGAGTVTYDASQGASPMDSLQHGAGVSFNLWSATGYGMPNLRMPNIPSLPPQRNPLNYRLVTTGTGIGSLNVRAVYRGPAVGGGPTPRVNIGHVFHGEINARGKAVGFHHEGSIGHSGTARISQIIDPPNALGVYRARVEIFDPSSGTWVVKNAPSTFFPTAWSRSQVLTEIRGAFGSGGIIRNNYWEGISPSGVRIGGYLDATGNINTAFPIY